MFSRFFLSVFTNLLPVCVNALSVSPEDLVAQYSLTTSTIFPFPTAATTITVEETEKIIVSDWSLNKGRIQNKAENLAFIDDPFPSSSQRSDSSTVLQVTYPAGSYSHATGGTQFENLWNSSKMVPFQSMVLSYQLAFAQQFDWVKGGKLPGIRGGASATGCSGGSQPTGDDCFSVRLMWRKDGVAEVYAYIPTPNNLCSDRSIVCNSDYGVSISRGAFYFTAGQWHTITLLVQLNDPVDVANGNLQLYYNGLQVISQTNLQFRSVNNLTANGLYFSTFFGGGDDSWATPNTTQTYFRDIKLWGGSTPSTLTGDSVNLASTLCIIRRLIISLLLPTLCLLLFLLM